MNGESESGLENFDTLLTDALLSTSIDDGHKFELAEFAVADSDLQNDQSLYFFEDPAFHLAPGATSNAKAEEQVSFSWPQFSLAVGDEIEVPQMALDMMRNEPSSVSLEGKTTTQSNSVSGIWKGPRIAPNKGRGDGSGNRFTGIAGKRSSKSKRSYQGTSLEDVHPEKPVPQRRLQRTSSEGALRRAQRATSDGAQRRARRANTDGNKKERKKRVSSRGRKERGGSCVCCEATSTPLWREGRKGDLLCNACGIRWVKYGIACESCKYVPRKSEATKLNCPRCETKFPPPEEEALKRRAAPSARCGGKIGGNTAVFVNSSEHLYGAGSGVVLDSIGNPLMPGIVLLPPPGSMPPSHSAVMHATPDVIQSQLGMTHSHGSALYTMDCMPQDAKTMYPINANGLHDTVVKNGSENLQSAAIGVLGYPEGVMTQNFQATESDKIPHVAFQPSPAFAPSMHSANGIRPSGYEDKEEKIPVDHFQRLGGLQFGRSVTR